MEDGKNSMQDLNVLYEDNCANEENDESNNFHTSHDWVLNNANSIFTPYVQFDLSDKGEQQKSQENKKENL